MTEEEENFLREDWQKLKEMNCEEPVYESLMETSKVTERITAKDIKEKYLKEIFESSS